jgi:hypothetical protein
MAFLAAYLKAEDRSRWVKIVVMAAAVFVVLDVFKRYLGVWWPAGLLGEALEESLPWLF